MAKAEPYRLSQEEARQHDEGVAWHNLELACMDLEGLEQMLRHLGTCPNLIEPRVLVLIARIMDTVRDEVVDHVGLLHTCLKGEPWKASA